MKRDRINNSPNETTTAYISDITYTSIYNPLLNPLNIYYISIINGYKQMGFEGTFDYLDLGCGDGTTLITLASLFPEARFTGIDLNKEHIRIANKTTAAKGLTNVNFHEQNFKDLDHIELSMFDYIVCYGTYSWISTPLQNAIEKFIGKSLKQDGLFLIHYAAKPGKVQIDPLWNLMRTVPEKQFKNSVERASHGIELIQSLKKTGSIFFKENPLALARANALESQDPAYVAHEALTDWQAFYHADIASRMSGAGLTFVGSINPEDNHLITSAPAPFHDVILKAERWGMRETVTDFVINRGIRTDIFINSKDLPGETRDISGIKSLHVGLLSKDNSIQKEYKCSNGIVISYTRPIYQGIVIELRNGSRTITELYECSQLSEYKKPDILNAVYMLIAGKQVMPVARLFTTEKPGPAKTIKPMSRGIEEILNFGININQPVYIPHPQSGQCLVLEPMTALTLSALIKVDRQAAPQWLYNQLIRANHSATQAGTRNISDEQLKAIVIHQASYVENVVLPTLQGLGLLSA
jgi:SAM-dependent methyltransferase